jgi:uncharacterized protein
MNASSDVLAAENPFVFDRPLEDAEQLVGRSVELSELISAIGARQDAIVAGPQRHGKTSLVNAALAASVDAAGGLGVRVDCAGVLTAADLARRLEAAYARAWAAGTVEEALVERLEALPLLSSDTADPAARLTSLLEVAPGVARQTHSRALIALDEVQDALALPALAGLLEAVKSRGGTQLGLVFIAPELPTEALATVVDRSASVSVGPIEPGVFGEEIVRRFAATGRDAGEAGQVIATVGAGHPQRSSLLAAELWDLTGDGQQATVATARAAIEQALTRCEAEFEVRWSALHGNERRVAVAIANEIAPQGTRAQRATGLAGPGAAQRALQGLKASGVARARQDGTTLTDPLFAEWLRRRHSQAPVEPDWQALRRRAELRRGGIRRGL